MKQIHGLLALALIGLTLIPVDCRAGEWGLGVGVAARKPPQQGAENEVVGMPFPQYEGERLSLTFGSVGYSLTNSDRFRIALEGQLRFDGYDPDASTALAGMEERDVTLDAGFSITTGGSWGIASLKILGDALGVHEGYEISASYAYPMQLKRWTIVPSIGLKLPSSELVDYYYGVEIEEVTDGRPVYSGRSVVNTSVGVNVVYKIADHWQVIGGAEYVRLGDGITDSPIIERDYDTGVYSALVYLF